MDVDFEIIGNIEASVKILNGQIRRVELHWYEAHGIGRKDMKIKQYLDE